MDSSNSSNVELQFTSLHQYRLILQHAIYIATQSKYMKAIVVLLTGRTEG